MSPEKFWTLVSQQPEGCWLWAGSRDRLGYGRVCMRLDGQRVQLAHRAAFILARGFHPNVLDHLCRTPSCVNPDHLESVTQAENMHRIRRPYCKRGHLMSETRIVRPTGKSICGLCYRLGKQAWADSHRDRVHASQARYAARKRAARQAVAV